MSDRKTVSKDMTIGEIRALGSKANKVMDEIFGPGCFRCEHSKTKTLEFGATVHGKDPDQVIQRLNEEIGSD